MKTIRTIKIVGLTLAFILLNITLAKTQPLKPEIVLQSGHNREVTSIAYSSDGKLLASGSPDKTIKLWDAVTGLELRTLTGHSGSVSSIQFSRDGSFLVSGSDDTTIKLWNVKTGQELRSLSGRGYRIREITLSPDNKLLASASEEFGDSNIQLWDLETSKEIRAFSNVDHSLNDDHPLKSLVFSPDGKLLVGGGSGVIKIWEVDTGKEAFTIPGYAEALALSPNGKIIAVAEFPDMINLWNMDSGNKLDSIELPSSFSLFISLEFSIDNKNLAIGVNHNLWLWDIERSKVIRTFEEHSTIYDIALSPSGKVLTSSTDRSVRQWDLESGKELSAFSQKPKNFVGDAINSVRLNPDGKLLVFNNGNRLKLWDVTSGDVFHTLSGHKEKINSVAFSADGKLLASASQDAIKVWDVVSRRELYTIDEIYSDSLVFSPDGRFLAGATFQKRIFLWDVMRGKILNKFDEDSTYIKDLKFSPDGNFLVSASFLDIKLWDVATGKKVRDFEYKTSPNYYSWQVNSVVFSLNGELIVTGHDGNMVRFWDVKSSKELFGVEGHKGTGSDSKNVNSVALSPNGELIASGGDDNTVKVWDIKNGKELHSFTGHTYSVNTVMFDPTGELVVSSSNDNTIKLWDVVSGKEKATLSLSSEKDWVITTPEGLFDGTSAAWRQIIWRFNNNTFDYLTVETYFNDFFYPNLLQDVFAGKSPKPKAGAELEKSDRRQPKVEIASINGQSKAQFQSVADKRTAIFVIEVADNNDKKKQPNHQETSGANDLRLFRNGSLVKVWRDDVFDTKKSGCETIRTKQNEPRRVRCSAEIPIVAGENNFTAYAFNSANVKSNDATAQIEGKFPKKEGTLYVLAIGVNDYAPVGKPNGVRGLDLDFAVPDVVDIGNAIRQEQSKLAQDAKLRQYTRTEVVTLKNETATKENILIALERFSKTGAGTSMPKTLCAKLPANLCSELKTELARIKPAEPEDALVVYFAGHGVSREERFYLLPHNYTGKSGEKSLIEQGVSDADLNDCLEKVDAGRLLMVIDACQSGGALGEKNSGRAPMNSKGLAQLAYDKGMLILTAAQSQQAALEAVNIGGRKIEHGLLTYALLEAMNNQQTIADKDANRQLWDREWFDYAVQQVPLLQAEAMKQRRIDLQNRKLETKDRSDIIYLNGDDPNLDPEKRRVQTPRVFYRRETDNNPMILARP